MNRLSFIVLIGSSLAVNAAWADSGQQIFESKCATCHGKDGKAQTKMGLQRKVPDLTNATVQGQFTDAKAIADVTNGVPEKKFPAFKDKLSADEITAVVAYVRTLAPKGAGAAAK